MKSEILRVLKADPARPYLNQHVGQIVEVDVPKKSKKDEDPEPSPLVKPLTNWIPRCIGWAHMLPSLDRIGRVWEVSIGAEERNVVVPFAVQSVSSLDIIFTFICPLILPILPIHYFHLFAQKWRFPADMHDFFQENLPGVGLSRFGDAFNRNELDAWGVEDEGSLPTHQATLFFIAVTKGVLTIPNKEIGVNDGKVVNHGKSAVHWCFPCFPISAKLF